MSPSTTQSWANRTRYSDQWTRRIRYSDQHIRVSDSERNAVAELLGQHYADGRLDQAEFDDLPETGPSGAGPAGPGGKADAGPFRGPRRRGGIARPLLLLLLVFICANVAWHAFTASLFFVQPLVWAFVIVAIVLLVNRSAHRHNR